MKVDRRSFLGLGLGAAAGVAVSPPNWKLMDDLSIWTQNWPWTPVPLDGEVTFENSVCSLCPGNCGISVRMIDGRPVKIEGRDGYPVNNGGICLHGVSALQYLYDPARIKTPLRKKGDSFEPVSWEEAVSLVAGKLADLNGQEKGKQIACISGTDQGTVAGLLERLLNALGSKNFLATETMTLSWQATMKKMQQLGHGVKASPGFDIDHADYILSFGCGLVEGWGSPVHNFQANSNRKARGATLVQVEPRLSNTASLADQWVPAKPGTEADLALGICSVMISEKLYNTDYIESGARGFEKFAALVTEKYTPDAVAGITGVEASKITALAKAFAGASAPIAIAGKGRGDCAGSAKEFAAVHALNCLAGNINKKGGVWISPVKDYATWPELAMESKPKGVKGGKTVSNLIAAINASDETLVEALLVYKANPGYAMNNPAAAQKALEKIPFIVSFSSYMDETTRQADIILPSHTSLELLEDLPGTPSMVPSVVGLARPVAGPIFDTNNPGDSVLMVAKALEGPVADGFPWETYEECLESVTGDLWSALSEDGVVVLNAEPPADVPGADFSFLVQDLASLPAAGDDTFPLVLVPFNNMRLISGAPASSPFAMKSIADTILKGTDGFIEINPETAHEYKLSQGDRATIETPNGSATVKVHLYDGIMPGLVAMTRGLGHEIGENRYIDGKGLNVNKLMSPVIDAASGLDAAWGIRAKISRV